MSREYFLEQLYSDVHPVKRAIFYNKDIECCYEEIASIKEAKSEGALNYLGYPIDEAINELIKDINIMKCIVENIKSC